MAVRIGLIFLSFVLVLIEINEGVLDVQTVTTAGTIMGKKKFLSGLNKYVEVYLGIPYAKPPLSDLRFKDPVTFPKGQHAKLGWEHFPSSCPQNDIDAFIDFKGADAWKIQTPVDENCLYLNIWKPLDGSTKKPVMVWIHGGGFIYGSSNVPMYDGSYLAAWSDAVVVSIQYRLGPFGFLYTGDDFAPGNVGLKDQVLALKWVNEHIDKFGGDKGMITIVGESAGSASVGMHLLNAETSKLFKRAIMLSGSPTSDWALLSSSGAKNLATELATQLGADNRSTDDVKRHLMNKSFNEILSKIKIMQKGDPLKFYFLPTIGSTLVSEHPVRMLKKANHLKGKELIVGWTKDEGSMFMLLELKLKKKITEVHQTPHIFEDFYKEQFAFVAGGDKNVASELAKLYKETGEKPFLKGLVNFKGDLTMKCPISQFIEEARKLGAMVYQFEYAHRSNNTGWPQWMGVAHGADLEMLFGVPLYNQSQFNYHDVEVCKQFMNRVKNFVLKGSPNIAGYESWFDNRMFLYGNADKDNRTKACARLKELMPHYLSGSISLHANFIGVLSLLLFLRVIAPGLHLRLIIMCGHF